MALFIQATVNIHTNRRHYSLYKVQCVVIFTLSLNNKNTWFLNKKDQENIASNLIGTF